jgi:hypothetical protein
VAVEAVVLTEFIVMAAASSGAPGSAAVTVPLRRRRRALVLPVVVAVVVVVVVAVAVADEAVKTPLVVDAEGCRRGGVVEEVMPRWPMSDSSSSSSEFVGSWGPVSWRVGNGDGSFVEAGLNLAPC